MNAVIIRDGVVIGVVDLEGKTIDADGRAARGPASYVIEGPRGIETVGYEAVEHAPDAAIFMASDEAGPGWTWTSEGGFRPPEQAAATLDERRAAARAECARRIFARASAATQVNISLHVGLIGSVPETRRSTQDKADLLAALDGKTWIEAMRARWPEVAAEALDPLDDANWPKPSAAALALAARF